MTTEASNYSFDTMELGLYNEKSFLLGTTPIPPALEGEVLVFEKLIGSSLPADYRQFLKKLNGGSPRKQGVSYFCYPVKWGKNKFSFLPLEESYGIASLFTLNPEFVAEKKGKDVAINISLEYKYKEFKDLEDMGYPHVPRDMIPIGSTPVENDMVLLGIDGERYGKVYYYMLQEDPEKPYENIGLISNSFEEFLLSLHPCE